MNNLEKAPSHKNVIILDTVLTREKKPNTVWNGPLPVELALSWMDFIGTVSLDGCSPTSMSDDVIQEFCRESLKEKCLFFF